MEFVQNFTPPDFQAKNFTPSISPNFNSFSKKKHKKRVKMEKFTPLGKILHCRRQWRHWQIPPLLEIGKHYSLGQKNARTITKVFVHCKRHKRSWKTLQTLKKHENHENTLKSHEKTLENHENLENMKELWKTMRNNLKKTKKDLEIPWKPWESLKTEEKTFKNHKHHESTLNTIFVIVLMISIISTNPGAAVANWGTNWSQLNWSIC